VLLKKEAVLTSTDRTFKMEMSFMSSMVGMGGQNRLETMIMAAMPGPEQTVSLDIMLQHVAQIQVGDLFRFCSRGAQGSINACKEMIGSLLQGRAPLLLGQSTPFLQDFRVKLQFFCTATGPDGEALKGQPAIQHLFDVAKGKDEGLVTLEELEPLHTYGFLLGARTQEEIKSLTAKVLAKVDSDGKNADKKHAKKRSQLNAAGSSSGLGPDKKRAKTDLELATDMFT
jgi:hypothetical protein